MLVAMDRNRDRHVVNFPMVSHRFTTSERIPNTRHGSHGFRSKNLGPLMRCVASWISWDYWIAPIIFSISILEPIHWASSSDWRLLSLIRLSFKPFEMLIKPKQHLMFNPHSNWTVSLDSTKVALVAWTRARHKLMQRLGGKRLQFAIENGPVEIVDLPI